MLNNTQIKTCLIIGDPVSQSLSPAMHNAAYKALGIDSQYIFIAKQVKSEELAFVMEKDLRDSNIYVFACTIPHKETIIKCLDKIDDTAKEIGAVNTVLNKGGNLKGYNTDWKGAVNALQKYTVLKNKKVSLLGSGGTARAIIYGLTKEGCEINIYSRNNNSALHISEQFKCKIDSWDKREESYNADIIINTTPIGKDDETSPISGEGITEKHVIFDVNYVKKSYADKNGNTELLHLAKSKNAVIINGLEMLLQQGILQFELYTGLKAPENVMREAISA